MLNTANQMHALDAALVGLFHQEPRGRSWDVAGCRSAAGERGVQAAWFDPIDDSAMRVSGPSG
jgi:hypothetical protein